MTFGYVVRPKADRDVDDLADSIAEFSGLDTALVFLSDIHDTFALIATQPDMGWPSKIAHPQLRAARTFRVSDRFDEILIFYLSSGDRIEILRVLHGAQDLPVLFSSAGALD